CLFGHIIKAAVPLVSIQHVLSVIGYEEVVFAVVIKITDTSPVAPSASCDTGLDGNIRESAIPVILIEMIGRLLAWRKALKRGSVHHEQVKEAIVVEIEQRNTTPHTFENILFTSLGASDVARSQASLGRHVHKFDLGYGNFIAGGIKIATERVYESL